MSGRLQRRSPLLIGFPDSLRPGSEFARRLALLLAITLVAALGTAHRALGADATAPVRVSGICVKSFADAAAIWSPDAQIDVLDLAVRSCASVDEWLAVAEMYPTPLGDTDALIYLDARCSAEDGGLAGYATCYDLGYYDIRPSLEEAAPGLLLVRGPARRGSDGPTASLGVEIILDTSSSMREQVAGVRKIDVAKGSLEILVRDGLAEGLPMALRTFGRSGRGKAGRCGSSLTVPLTPLDQGATLDIVRALDAGKKTRSPIAASLAAVADDLAGVPGPHTVILVTDGDETCGGDPVAAIEALTGATVDLSLNVVGFTLEDEAVRQRMVDWAATAGGRYYDATSADELAAAITSAAGSAIGLGSATTVTVMDADGEMIGEGTMNGGAIEVDAGTYRVEVGMEPPVVFDAVVIAGGVSIELEVYPSRPPLALGR